MAATPSFFQGVTGDPTIDGLLNGYKWNLDATRTINWSISDGWSGEYWADPNAAVAQISAAFASISTYANVTFRYVGYHVDPFEASAAGSNVNIAWDGVEIFNWWDSTWAVGIFPSAEYANDPPWGDGTAGDIYVNYWSDANTLPSYEPGSAGFFLMLHEIGHTLGLKHPFDDGGSGLPTYELLGIEGMDIDWFTMMAYGDDYPWNQTSWDPATPMVLDVLALQYLYGPNLSTNAGNETFQLTRTNTYKTIWDAAGTDTVSAASAGDGWFIVLPDEPLSTLVPTPVGFATPLDDFELSSPTSFFWLTGHIENATGSAFDDAILGSARANVLSGGRGLDYLVGLAGADTLNGGRGDDLLEGGLGNDTYVVDSFFDLVIELADEGTDLVQSSTDYLLDPEVENLTLVAGSAAATGTGNVLDNLITGNSANNSLLGLEGDDTLVGGGGADTMEGALGDDVYGVDNAGDVVVELADGGTRDQVNVSSTIAGGTYVLVDHIERGALLTSLSYHLTGNALDNRLVGNAASNRLDGGTGADTLYGGSGNDSYVVDDAGDSVQEAGPATDIDLVESSLTYTLGANLDRLTLTGTEAIDGTGNALANRITGNAADNVLDGLGGADTLAGGGGNDTFRVSLFKNSAGVVSLQDVVSDTAGTDTLVLRAGNLALTTAQAVTLGSALENLDISETGSNLLNLAGNASANVLTGNAVANVLTGGLGDDTMVGGLGSDTYIVDSAGDVIEELADQGSDLAKASVTYTLAANVERLTLTGTAEIDGFGNELHNLLTGNGAANLLQGGAGDDTLNGGAGLDTLEGGAGEDIYVVDHFGDVATELADEGAGDLVNVNVTVAGTYTLGDHVERATITSAAAVNLTGNALGNTLTGNDAANRLDGGAGADTLVGGAGNDAYVVDDAGDVVQEGARPTDIDHVHSSITYTLGANLERLTLVGNADINGTGNGLANRITGGDGANVLEGGGGADSLAGGAGDDTYVVNLVKNGAGLAVLQDTITEISGNDTLVLRAGNLGFTSAQSVVLAAGLEDLDIAQTGSNLLNLAGNAAANALTGNAAANLINGGAGADTLTGGDGRDVFRFNTAIGSDVDLITDFTVGVDRVRLDKSAFAALPAGSLSAGGLVVGEAPAAAEADDRLLYDTATGFLYYDADGVGANAAVHFATLSGAPALTHLDIFVV